MDDILAFIKMFLSMSWEFFKIDVPGTKFSVGVMCIGTVLVGVGFRFLSIILGHSLGEASSGASLTARAVGKRMKISQNRSHDVM